MSTNCNYTTKAVFRIALVFFLTMALVGHAKAQEKTAEELAKMAQNPLANMMSFPFQNNTTFGMGDFDRTSNVLNFQPVLPFFNGRLITRTIIPIISQPVGENDNLSGVGDITFTAFYSPSSKGGLIWGIGPAIVVPTMNDVSTRKWSAAPSVVLLKMTKKVVYGFVWNNIWSFAGDEDANDVNSMLFQYFFNYNIPKGWYLTTGPVVTANWEASDGNKWVVPFGGGGGKIVKIATIPVNLQAQAFYNAIKPDGYGGFTSRFQVQIMLSK